MARRAHGVEARLTRKAEPAVEPSIPSPEKAYELLHDSRGLVRAVGLPAGSTSLSCSAARSSGDRGDIGDIAVTRRIAHVPQSRVASSPACADIYGHIDPLASSCRTSTWRRRP